MSSIWVTNCKTCGMIVSFRSREAVQEQCPKCKKLKEKDDKLQLTNSYLKNIDAGEATDMSAGWIGVDLDGTLAEYLCWGDGKIGKPIPLMIDRVKEWLAQGKVVKIFTARVGPPYFKGDSFDSIITEIREWLEVNGLPRNLEITSTKDFKMIELWDDRCIQVIPNTGITVEEFITSRFIKDKRSKA